MKKQRESTASGTKVKRKKTKKTEIKVRQKRVRLDKGSKTKSHPSQMDKIGHKVIHVQLCGFGQ